MGLATILCGIVWSSFECSGEAAAAAACVQAADPAVVDHLRILRAAQVRLWSLDLDRNGKMEFWVRDIAGLARALPATDESRKSIETMAKADGAAPNPVPFHGYFFKAVPRLKKGNQEVALDDGAGWNASWYAVVAYPAKYAKGQLTYLVNADRGPYFKDTGGVPPEVLSMSATDDGWLTASDPGKMVDPSSVASSVKVRVVDSKAPCTGLAFAPNGQRLFGAVSEEGGKAVVRAWQFPEGRPEKAWGTLIPDPIHGIAVSPRGDVVAHWSWSGEIGLVGQDGVRRAVKTAERTTYGATFTKSGDLLAYSRNTRSHDPGVAQLWDPATLQEKRKFPPTQAFGWNADGTLAVALRASDGKTFDLVDVSEGKVSFPGKAPNGSPGFWLIDPQGKWVVGRDLRYNVNSSVVFLDGSRAPVQLAGLVYQTSIWAVSPDGKRIATGSADKSIMIWSMPETRHVRTYAGHTAGIAALAFSPDGKTLASGSSDGSVRLWEVE